MGERRVNHQTVARYEASGLALAKIDCFKPLSRKELESGFFKPTYWFYGYIARSRILKQKNTCCANAQQVELLQTWRVIFLECSSQVQGLGLFLLLAC